MKVSRFNYLVPSPKESKVHFLYNSLHDHRLAVEDDEVEIQKLLIKIRHGGQLNLQEQEAAGALKELGFLLDDAVDEEELFKEWMRKRVREQNEVLTVTLLTTLACNLRCTYCYEKDKLGKSKMTHEVLAKVISWVETRIQQTQPKKVNIIFFGGEPLLNMEAIRIFSRKIYPLCQRKGIEYSSGMATNGIFLKPDLVDELKTLGVTWVKITFDGDRCEHDKKRIYSGGRGTFDKIFENLEGIAGKLKILLGGNFDEENADSFKKLLIKLSHSKFKNDIIATNFKPIMPEMKEAEGIKGIGSSCARCTFTDFQINKLLELQEKTLQVGLKPTDPINMGPCEFYRRNALTIGIDGKFYKCIAFVGINGTEIGDADSQDYNAMGETMLHASKPFENPKCSKCAFPPVCGGGCRADAYNQTGSVENISCQQDYFKKAVMRTLPKEHYEGVKWAEQMGGV